VSDAGGPPRSEAADGREYRPSKACLGPFDDASAKRRETRQTKSWPQGEGAGAAQVDPNPEPRLFVSQFGAGQGDAYCRGWPRLMIKSDETVAAKRSATLESKMSCIATDF
jgi:hypothetical protein